MVRADRFARLFWFIVIIALSGLTLLTVLAWLGGMVSASISFVALAVCVGVWWFVVRALRHPDRLDLTMPRLRRLHLLPVPPTVPPDDVTALPTDAASDSAASAPTEHAWAGNLAVWSVAFGIGAVAGALLGVAIARIAPNVPVAWLLLCIAAVVSLAAAAGLAAYSGRRYRVARQARTLGIVAFVLSLGVFAFTRYAFIADYPIYFFSDEAIHTVQASDLLKNGLRGANGEWLPTYFPNGRYWNLSLSVYAQAITTALFGKSIEVTRLTSATFAVLGALATGLTMKLVFRQPTYWVVVLFLAMTPTWFLHSRTAFETVLMVACYSGFLLFYLLYRYRATYYLFPALACGAATLYAYTNGQAVMLMTGVLLALSDLRYHLRHRRTAVLGIGFIIVLAIPYVRFRIEHPEAITSQLRILDSYLFAPIPAGEKLMRFLREYGYGLSPLYWFLPNGTDLDRYVMKGYGHIMLWTLPFFAIGVAVCVRNIKSSMHRAVLIAALAAPFGSALAQIAVTRALLFVVPAAMLSAIGFEWLVDRLRSARVRALVTASASAAFALAGLWLWQDALVNGSTWVRNYGLYGMQWGARQLFEQAVPAYLSANPGRVLEISPSWANGTDVLMKFFDVGPARVSLLNVDHYLERKQPLAGQTTWVMLPDEVQRAAESGKFKPLLIEQVIPAPDGSDAFIFARAQYADGVDAMFAQEEAARQQLITTTVMIEGQPMSLAHSRLDIGQPQDMFDGDTFTLARGADANPFVVEFAFDPPREIAGLHAVLGRMDFSARAQLFSATDPKPREYTGVYPGLPGEPSIALDFRGAPKDVTKLRLEIEQLNPPEDVHIHVRELSIKLTNPASEKPGL